MSGNSFQVPVFARVIEQWGESPIFSGPSWRLSWSLDPDQSRRVDAAILRGSLGQEIQSGLDKVGVKMRCHWGLAISKEQQQIPRNLMAIADVAQSLLSPACIHVCHPLAGLRVEPPSLVLRSDQHDLLGQALRIGARLVRAADLSSCGVDVSAEWSSLKGQMDDLAVCVTTCCHHKLTMAQLAEASRRRIPVFLIDPGQRLYQLGTGSRSRWISSTCNDRDSALGAAISNNKSLSSSLLKKLGLPVPREIRIPAGIGREWLIKQAKIIGFPCVIKPQDAEQGRGVTSQIVDNVGLWQAFLKAKQFTSSSLLLQEHIDGDDYRLNLVNGELIFVVRRAVPSVIGNGCDNLADLFERENHKRRQLRQKDGLSKEIDLQDAEVKQRIARAGLSMDSILDPGFVLRLRGNANISTGGLREELPISMVHPEIRRQCQSIAKSFRLDCCGIDYIVNDISQDPATGGGVFIEVNAMPQNAPSRASLLLDNLFSTPHLHSVAASVVIADWGRDDSRNLDEKAAWIEKNLLPAIVAIPSAIQDLTFPFVSRYKQFVVRIYEHPRELLLDSTTGSVVYLVTPELVLSKGLPLSYPDRLICWVPRDRLNPAPAWEGLLNKYQTT